MSEPTYPPRLAIVGCGRLGRALASSFRQAAYVVAGPLSRDYEPGDVRDTDVVLLCVPDREIHSAAQTLTERLAADSRCPFVGHCSGASTLEVLDPLPEDVRFSLHPLMSFASERPCSLEGVTAAVSGQNPSALATATALASDVGMNALEIAEDDRVAYHAAASISSNFLITLQSAAELLAASAGCGREALLPLLRATVENWALNGPGALTGPIARGDGVTVERQRAAVAQRTPQLLELFDVLTAATVELTMEPVAL